MTRTPSRLEAIAVLRGEMQWHLDAALHRRAEGHDPYIHEQQAAAVRRAIDVLEGNTQPRGKYNGEAPR